MGTLTYAEIKTEVLAALGNRSSFDTDRLAVIVNLSQMRIARAKKWEELDATSGGTLTFSGVAIDDKFHTLPSGTRSVYTFRLIMGDGQSRKLERKSKRFFDSRIPEPQYYATGKPEMYTVFAGKAEMWRVPDSAYTYDIRRCKWPLAFTGEGDTSQVSELDEKDDMLTALSISWTMQSIGRSEDAARWWRIYTNMLNSAMNEDTENPDELIAPDFELANLQRGDYWVDPWDSGDSLGRFRR